MLAIGRAMMSNLQFLMLDEPSLGLSPLLCKELFANLGVVRKAGIGIFLVEQNARQSLAIADGGYLLENARIIHEDAADKLMHDPAVQKAYLGGTGKAAKPEPVKDSPIKPQPIQTRPSHAAPRMTADQLLGTSLLISLPKPRGPYRARQPPAQ
ncbi:MAG: branched-chain amino acid transport system ATP-binding protein [Paracoccaceae bacterium]|jgi:branched-chain amino acid transport system ATP-binding protein